MYHRFEENKYPSTNIRLQDFQKHLELIKKEKIRFINPKNFEDELRSKKEERKILLTIDDGFASFYKNAWPILKREKIPFILFVSTREIGSFNYMTWDQIKEIAESELVEIGNHSHSHEYLVDEDKNLIKQDIVKSMELFKNNLKNNSSFFSYPFGEYSLEFKKIIQDLNFKYAFGQHSGVIDETKDLFELPRFPINEKYGEIERFKTLIKTLPLKYVEILPTEKYLISSKNPPKVKIKFFKDTQNLNLLNCYSNEGDKWRASKIEQISEEEIKIHIQEKFIGERGRINCSLREEKGFWRWLGIQFVISDK